MTYRGCHILTAVQAVIPVVAHVLRAMFDAFLLVTVAVATTNLGVHEADKILGFLVTTSCRAESSHPPIHYSADNRRT